MIEWHNNKIEKKSDSYSAASMTDHVLGNLKITLGKPYLFVHQGNCEHVVIITSMRFVTSNLLISSSQMRSVVLFKLAKDVYHVRKGVALIVQSQR